MARTVILCVDDEKVILDTLERQIRKSQFSKQYDIEIAESGEEALEIIADLEQEGAELAVIISDQIMPGMKGDELLISVNGKHPETLKILLTGQASLEAVTNAINQAKLYRYVAKPWDDTDLMLTIEEAARSFQQYHQIIEYDQHNRLLKALNYAARDISGEMKVSSIINKFVKSVQVNTEAERVFLILSDPSGSVFRIEYFNDTNQEVYDQDVKRLALGSSIWAGELITEIKLIIDKPQPQGHKMVLKLERGEDLAGFLYVLNPYSKRPFNENQYHILKMLENQASTSYENARLYTSIEETNKDILDSIEYARRIQYSLLSNPTVLENFFSDYFIIYQPKDIVSGDFYWFVEEQGYLFVAAVDCTGHGVPGAFMSVLGSTQLNEIVKQQQILDTGSVLSELHQRIAFNLGKNIPDAKIYDGMDLSLCRFDAQLNSVDYSGANRPLLIIRDHGTSKEVIEIAGDKKPIGHTGPYEDVGGIRTYNVNTHSLQKGDEIYLFSDGFTDQFGAETHKKFGKKRLIQTCIDLKDQPFKSRGTTIENIMNEWQGALKSIDDRLLIGLKKN